MIRIELPFPPSANTAYADNGRRGGRHLSKKAKAWQDEAILLCQETVCHIKPPERFTLAVGLWMPTKARRDVDNYIKLPKDALCSAWGIDDDFTRIPRVVVEYRGIVRGGRCVLEVEALDGDIVSRQLQRKRSGGAR
jgi:crossover junction endodeoxyribonuclease RusA